MICTVALIAVDRMLSSDRIVLSVAIQVKILILRWRLHCLSCVIVDSALYEIQTDAVLGVRNALLSCFRHAGHAHWIDEIQVAQVHVCRDVRGSLCPLWLMLGQLKVASESLA